MAVGYRRCSSDQQADSGLGLEAQQAAIEDAARRLGLDLGAVHTDAAISGSAPAEERPGLLAAISDLGRGDVLLVARRDRLGRDVVAVALIERFVAKRGARIVSAAGEGSDLDGPSGPLVRTILDAVNAYERAQIALRTKLALRAKRARGERAGAVPFGYAVGGDGKRLDPDDGEQDALGLIRRLRADGWSLRRIAAALNAQGIPAKHGGRWQHSGVLSVLRTLARHAS